MKATAANFHEIWLDPNIAEKQYVMEITPKC
jgi:hypothetical protein